MKGDFTRSTFHPKKHYSSVRMQQGRVQLDADWNEQLDIEAHLDRIQAGDVIGLCGAPFHVADQFANFQIRPAGNNFEIAPGRFYVDGILCENDSNAPIPATAQPHVPQDAQNPSVMLRPAASSLTPLPLAAGNYLAYLDVWHQHITGLEDPDIVEVALNGPDTATRTKTIWQVKLLKLDRTENNISVSQSDAWKNQVLGGERKLAARAQPQDSDTNPCVLPTGAGFRRLENQLYRVEVHKGGNLGVASFKWSRDNGSLVTAWKDQSGANKERLRVESIGRDNTLRFDTGQWIELTDNAGELKGEPGTLAQIVSVEGLEIIIDPQTATGTILMSDFDNLRKVRRWDMPADAPVKQNGGITIEVPLTNQGFLQLEDGVEVNFSSGPFVTGDYWLIPARTISGGIEWPVDDAVPPAPPTPRPVTPYGVKHHVCPLTLLDVAAGGAISMRPDSDCRPKFPPVTQLTSFFYAGGDGQEAKLNEPLKRPLTAGVSNGKWPVKDARVRFKIDATTGNGKLLDATTGAEVGVEQIVNTDDRGIVRCGWKLEADEQKPSQQVLAELLDAADNRMHLPIRFTANLSLANQVSYVPPAGCKNLAGDTDVQAAINRLASLPTLSCVGGDGQDAAPGVPLELPLTVLVASACGPTKEAKVSFEADGNGKVAKDKAGLSIANNKLELATGADGTAACFWMLDPKGPASQQLTARLVLAQGQRHGSPASFEFTANLISVGKDPAIVIKRLTMAGEDLKNDSVVSLTRLAKGIEVSCDSTVAGTPVRFEPGPIGRAKCFVTLEIPGAAVVIAVPPTSAPTLAAGFQPFILDADSTGKENLISWSLAPSVNTWLEREIGGWKARVREKGILARFVLKGNFIFTAGDPPLYLDGETLGQKKNELLLPSGDGRRGGDFEMWFWLA